MVRLKVRLRLAMRVDQRRAAALSLQGASPRMMRVTEEMEEEMSQQRERRRRKRTEEIGTMGRLRVVRRKKVTPLKERLLERRVQSEEMTERVRVKSRRLPRQRWRSSVLTQDVRAKTWREAMHKRHRGPCRA